MTIKIRIKETKHPDLDNPSLRTPLFDETIKEIKEMLPLMSTLGYYRPFMLNKDLALYI